MRYSFSRVSLFEDCPYHFKLRYIDQLTEMTKYDANNPLLIGNALHGAIENGIEQGIQDYYDSFPVLTDDILLEAMKIEILVPKINKFLEQFGGFEAIHEYKIERDNFLGYVDLILTDENGDSIVIDFKYSNHIKNYKDSGQLHVYKHYLEQDGFNVKKMGFLFAPKVTRKQDFDNGEDLYDYRKRVLDELSGMDVTFLPIEYDEMNVIYFQNSIKKIESATKYPKNVSGNCFGCKPRFAPNYLEAIQNEKGDVVMVLPTNERREIEIDENPDFWIYGDSYVGKSTFVDNVENVLFLNTDGNTDNTTAPVKMIKDVVRKEGRRTIRESAWESFLEVIDALETDENTFEAVAIDLMEDLYEHCRFYVFEKNGWEHESDGGFGKGWSKVTTEWQSAIKRLKALGYQVIYISKELRTEITLKGGSTRTTFKPNINDKVANFLTGTVDLTMRAFANSDDERFLQLEKKNNTFGGGRYPWQVETCALDHDEFLDELIAAQESKDAKPKRKKKEDEPKEDKLKRTRKKRDEEDPAEEEKPKRERKKRDPEPEESEESTDDTQAGDEKPKRQRKSRKTETETEDAPKTRKRRERKPVEDDETPPGEGEDDTADSEEKEEKPAGRRRRKRRA